MGTSVAPNGRSAFWSCSQLSTLSSQLPFRSLAERAPERTRVGGGVELIGEEPVAIKRGVKPLAGDLPAEAEGEQVRAREVVDLGRLPEAVERVMQGRRAVAIRDVALLARGGIVGVGLRGNNSWQKKTLTHSTRSDRTGVRKSPTGLSIVATLAPWPSDKLAT